MVAGGAALAGEFGPFAGGKPPLTSSSLRGHVLGCVAFASGSMAVGLAGAAREIFGEVSDAWPIPSSNWSDRIEMTSVIEPTLLVPSWLLALEII